MFVCEVCGGVFEEPGKHIEYHTEVDFMQGEEFACCPFCGMDDIAEAVACDTCGKIIAEDDTEYCLCQHCRKETMQVFKEMLQKNFTPNEREFIANEWFD